MKRKTFKTWFSTFEFIDNRNRDRCKFHAEKAFHTNDEYIDHQAKRIAELEEIIKNFENTGMIGSSPAQFMEKIIQLESLFKDNGGCIKTAMQLLNEHSATVKELEEKNEALVANLANLEISLIAEQGKNIVVKELKSRIEKLRAALEFYGDKNNWKHDDYHDLVIMGNDDVDYVKCHGGLCSDTHEMAGKTARTALREDGGNNEKE